MEVAVDMKKLSLFLTMLVFLPAIASATTLSTFNDSSTAVNITFSAAGSNMSAGIKLPQSVTVSSARMNVTGFSLGVDSTIIWTTTGDFNRGTYTNMTGDNNSLALDKAVLLNDSFNSAVYPGWAADTGTWNSDSGFLQQQGAASPAEIHSTTMQNVSNYNVSVRIKWEDTAFSGGVYLRFRNTSHYWLVFALSGAWSLYYNKGSLTQEGGTCNHGMTYNTWYDVIVNITGGDPPTIGVRIPGVSSCSWTATTTGISTGGLGFRANGKVIDIDNVTVRELTLPRTGSYTSNTTNLGATIASLTATWNMTNATKNDNITIDATSDGLTWLNIQNNTQYTSGYGSGTNIQWRANFSTNDTNLTPYLHDLTITTSSSYPTNVTLNAGNDNSIEWAFNGTGFGSLGKQTQFNDSSTAKNITFSAAGQNLSLGIYLPKTAQISSATMDMSGYAIGAVSSMFWTTTGDFDRGTYTNTSPTTNQSGDVALKAEFEPDLNTSLLMHFNWNSSAGENGTLAVGYNQTGTANGTFIGSASWNCTQYKFGGCSANIGTSDSYINLPLVSSCNATWESWVYLKQTGIEQMLWGRDNPGGDRFMQCGIRGATNKPYCYIWNAAGSLINIDPASASPALVAERWYHLAYVYDGISGTLKIYLNGTEVGSTTSAGFGCLKTASSTEPFAIGCYNPSGGCNANGNFLVDEARISNTTRYASNFTPNPYPRTGSYTSNTTATGPLSALKATWNATGLNWTQTSQSDFNNGTLTNVSATGIAGSVALLRQMERFDDGNYNVEPTWTPQSGTWSAANKYLEKTSGTAYEDISTPSTKAYGNWSFSVNHNGNLYHEFWMGIISSAPNPWDGGTARGQGYILFIENEAEAWKRFNLYRNNNGVTAIISSSKSALDTGWHNVTVTRNMSGGFEIFYDGVSKGNVIDNTYTTSKYFSVGMRQNNFVDNITEMGVHNISGSISSQALDTKYNGTMIRKAFVNSTVYTGSILANVTLAVGYSNDNISWSYTSNTTFTANNTQEFDFADVTGRYIRWNATLQTNNTNITPELHSVDIEYVPISIEASSDGTTWLLASNNTQYTSGYGSGSNLRWRANFSTDNASLTPYLHDMNLSYNTNLYPTSVTLNVGNTGTEDWSFSRELNNTNSPNTTSDFSSKLNTVLSTCSATTDNFGNQYCNITINVTSGTAGVVGLNNISIVYSYNARANDFSSTLTSLLSTCTCSGCFLTGSDCTVPIRINSSTAGIVEISDLSIEYTSALAGDVITRGYVLDSKTGALLANVNVTAIIQETGARSNQTAETGSFSLALNSTLVPGRWYTLVVKVVDSQGRNSYLIERFKK